MDNALATLNQSSEIRVQVLISSHLQPSPEEKETDDLQGKLAS